MLAYSNIDALPIYKSLVMGACVSHKSVSHKRIYLNMYDKIWQKKAPEIIEGFRRDSWYYL